jgi:outer membrane receptor protein involved in Fe transport
MFYTLSIRHNYYRYNDYAYKDVEDSRYIQAGWPRSHSNYELGAVIQGVDLGRFHQRTDCSVLKGSLTSQATKYHLIKAGLEAQYSEIGFGAPNTIVKETIGGKDQLVIHYDDTLYPGVRTYYPTSLAVYVQDRIEFPEFLVRIGIRSEYFDANSSIPSDLQNPANAIRDVPKSHPKRTTPKVSVAPRLGISYALSDKGALYFSYGHFYQMPGLGILYSNSNYDVLRNLASGGVSYGIMGNPDIKPEFTTQYEFGFKSQFGENLGIDVSTFYKDIRDLLGVEFISTYADADYARFTNVDFGSVYGVTLAYTQQFTSSLFAALSYTFQKAEGNSSDPRETATRAQAGADSRPRQVPFDWDQRHTLNATVSFSVPNDYSITVIGRYGSGTPYTPVVGSGFGAELEENSSSKPPFVLVDLRAEKEFVFSGMKLNVFGRVTNLFDTEYANGFVFATTGSPDYSLTPGTDIASLSNPSRYYSPRRIEIGLGIRY